jgi:predicted metal-dependent phosphotriesterase family hydrolase
MSYVNTVLGAIHPDELGVTATHEHIFWGPPGWEYDPEWWFHTPKVFAKCLADLVEYRELGGKTVVCCSGIGMGRDVEMYRLLSRYSGVNIIAGSGFHEGRNISNHFRAWDIDRMADLFVHELTVGIGDSGTKAGFIKVGHGVQEFTALEELEHRAAARAAKRTGCAIITHGAWFGLQELAIFASEGLDLSRVVVSHCSDIKKLDPERDKQMAAMGAFTSYDTFTINPTWNVGSYAGADEIKADAVKKLIDAGYIEQLILSSDVNLFSLGWARSSPYTGKTTMADMLRYLPGALRRVGISEEITWRVLVKNPKKVLPIFD